MLNKNESAFPSTEYGITGTNEGEVVTNHFGLTKRELFAAMAMQAIVEGDNTPPNEGLSADNDHIVAQLTRRDWRKKQLARTAVDAIAYADALLSALERKPNGQ